MVGKRSGLDDETVEMLGKEIEKGIGFGAELIIAMMAGAVFAIFAAIFKSEMVFYMKILLTIGVILIVALLFAIIYRGDNNESSSEKTKNFSPATPYSKLNQRETDARWRNCPYCRNKIPKTVSKCYYCKKNIK